MAAGAAALTGWDQQRAGQAVSGAMARFGLDPSRPADVSAAQVYVKAGQYVPMNLAWDVPYAGPAHDRVSEAVMRAEQADPGLFDRAYGDADPGAFRKLDGVVRDALADAGGAGAKLPPGGPGQVRSDGECDEDGNVGPSSLKPRLPSKDGSWTGEPGNSGWQSSLPKAAAATGGVEKRTFKQEQRREDGGRSARSAASNARHGRDRKLTHYQARGLTMTETMPSAKSLDLRRTASTRHREARSAAAIQRPPAQSLPPWTAALQERLAMTGNARGQTF